MDSMGGLTNKEGYSVAMRLLIHLVADIHQPLHAGGRMNSEYPKGDRGGNGFKLKRSRDGWYNLHSSYDSVLGDFAAHSNQPFSRGDWENICFQTDALKAKFPVEKLKNDPKDIDFDTWA
jgi:hypothetical protein